MSLPRLGFLPHMVADIIMGRKQQTLRLARNRAVKKMTIGEPFIARAQGHDFALCFVTDIDVLRVSNLTVDDARREGCETLSDLLRGIEKIYGEGNHQLTRVQFRFLDKPENALPPDDVGRVIDA